MDPVEEIKQRLDVSEVVGGYVQLKQAGANHRGLCPFHHERTPSFMVSDQKGIWHCFGCGEGGDVFSFVEKIEGLDFRETLENLAKRAGVKLPAAGRVKTDGNLKEKLLKILELATKYYQTALIKSPEAQNYVIQQRGFNKEALSAFRLGYAPDTRNGLVNWLRRHGFNDSEIIKAGLAHGGRSQLQDLFHGRIMVPLADVMGQTIGFTGRILGEGEPKYLNTPSTLLFDKSRYVFGLSQAKAAIREADEAVLVEGNLDVVTAHQFGSRQVVATSGIALSRPQLKILARITKNLKLAFDQDSAGVNATERAIPLAQSMGLSLYIVEMPAKDPDELIRRDLSSWQASLKNAPYVMDWLLKALLRQNDSASVPGKKQITNRFSDILALLEDPVEQDHYIQALAKTIKIEPAAVARRLEQRREPKTQLRVNSGAYQRKSVRDEGEAAQEAILGICLTYPDSIISLDDLREDHFTTPERQKILAYLGQHRGRLNSETLPKELQLVGNYVKILLLQGEENYGSWSSIDRRIEAFSLASRLERLRIKRVKRNLAILIRQADVSGDSKRRQELLRQFSNLGSSK